jgi:hypothetical protein
MNNNYILLENELPQKGKDIIGIDESGNEYYVFRCFCPNENCTSFRDSLIGSEIMVDIIKWKYTE